MVTGSCPSAIKLRFRLLRPKPAKICWLETTIGKRGALYELSRQARARWCHRVLCRHRCSFKEPLFCLRRRLEVLEADHALSNTHLEFGQMAGILLFAMIASKGPSGVTGTG